MQMEETARFIRALQYVGWSDNQINQLILYIGEGGDIAEMLGELRSELNAH